MLPAGLAVLMMMIFSGCGNLDNRLSTAAETSGAVKAAVNLPALPDDCRTSEPHAILTTGAELRSVLKRERSALDRANARTGRCAAVYDDIRYRFGRSEP